MQDNTAFIVGVDSLIGRALEDRLLRYRRPVVGSTRRPAAHSESRIRLDLSDPPQEWRLPDRIATAWILAGVTSITKCEAEPVATRTINMDHTLALAREISRRGGHVIFVSTNLVLSGDVADAPVNSPVAPQCEYARQKAGAERQLLAGGISASVLRITKVAETLLPLLENWSRDLLRGQPIKPFSDLVCAPLRCEDLINALITLADARSAGLFQIGARPDVGYDEIALRLARFLGAPEHLVQPTTSTAAGVFLQARPRFTTLDTTGTEAQFDLPPLHTEIALEKIFMRLKALISDRKGRDN